MDTAAVTTVTYTVGLRTVTKIEHKIHRVVYILYFAILGDTF